MFPPPHPTPPRDLTECVYAHGVPQYVLLPYEVWEQVVRVLDAVDETHSKAEFRDRDALSQTPRAIKTLDSTAKAVEWILATDTKIESCNAVVERLQARNTELEEMLTQRPSSPKTHRKS